MFKRFLGVAAFFVFATVASAHTVDLSWVLSSQDVAAACTAAGSCHQTVYRAPGSCAAPGAFVALATISATQATYADTGVAGGEWCYGVSFTLDGTESTKDTLTVSLQPTPPSGLKVTKTT